MVGVSPRGGEISRRDSALFHALARNGDGPPFATQLSVTVSARPKRARWVARLTVGVAVLGGIIAILATPRASRIQPGVGSATFLTGEPEIEAPAPDPLWTLAAASVARIGFRGGHRHALEVVPLGPGAVEVEIRTARAFLAMRTAALHAGVELGLVSGFRTAAEQRALFRAWRKGRGNKAARPGQSNHQSGRALDIGGVGVPGTLAWLETNAASFGFKRTVKNEPWHWEYVDAPIARGATKRVTRKHAKTVKVIGQATRPARRRIGTGLASSRVASLR